MDKYNDEFDFREVKDDETDSADQNALTEQKEEKERDYEDVCYICHRPESVAGKMIHIPNDICICSDCMQRTFDSMSAWNMTPSDDAHNMNMNNSIDLSKIPGISMINLSDLGSFGGFMPNS